MKLAVLVAVIAGSLAGCTSDHDRAAGPSPLAIVANEAAAMSRLRAIVSAEMAHQVEAEGKFATLEELIRAGALGDLSTGALGGYRFDVRLTPGGFEATAVPEAHGVTGQRSFYVDHSRLMHAADTGGLPASASDPAVQ